MKQQEADEITKRLCADIEDKLAKLNLLNAKENYDSIKNIVNQLEDIYIRPKPNGWGYAAEKISYLKCFVEEAFTTPVTSKKISHYIHEIYVECSKIRGLNGFIAWEDNSPEQRMKEYERLREKSERQIT